MNEIKRLLTKYKKLSFIVAYFYTNVFGLNRIRGRKSNRIQINNCYLNKCRIENKGIGNEIIMGNQCVLKKCKIYIHGDNNKVILADRVSAIECEIHIEDNNNNITIGSDTHISGNTHLACIEGTTIEIGKKCLFSSDITFRTGDSHSILNMNGERINPSKDILVGNHVWIGNKVTITKGVKISENSIIATGAVVTNKFEQSNVILGGVPAIIIKREINWDEQRIII